MNKDIKILNSKQLVAEFRARFFTYVKDMKSGGLTIDKTKPLLEEVETEIVNRMEGSK